MTVFNEDKYALQALKKRESLTAAVRMLAKRFPNHGEAVLLTQLLRVGKKHGFTFTQRQINYAMNQTIGEEFKELQKSEVKDVSTKPQVRKELYRVGGALK